MERTQVTILKFAAHKLVKSLVFLFRSLAGLVEFVLLQRFLLFSRIFFEEIIVFITF